MGRVLAALVAIAVLLGVYAFFIEPRWLVVVRETLELETWTGPPLRIVLLSDIHAGAPYVRQEKLGRLVTLANEQQPDVIFLLGDYVVERELPRGRFIPPEETARFLAKLRARLGVYAVLGNHDGWLDKDRVTRAFEANGIPMLRNETAAVDAGDRTFVVAGLEDLWTGRPDYSILAGDGRGPIIALTHNPDVFPKVPAHVAITFAGHTHGGQVSIPLLGRPVVPSGFGERYSAGHVVEDGKHLYVTTGIGTSIMPVRFRVVPEVRVVELRPARPAARPSPARAASPTP